MPTCCCPRDAMRLPPGPTETPVSWTKSGSIPPANEQSRNVGLLAASADAAACQHIATANAHSPNSGRTLPTSTLLGFTSAIKACQPVSGVQRATLA